MNILENLKHSATCWITMNNTKLLDNDLYWLWYQIIKCEICNKQYIVFRDNINTYIEDYDDQNKTYIKQFYIFLWHIKENIKELEKKYNVFSNLREYIKYPIWDNKLLISLQDKNNWEMLYEDVLYDEIVDNLWNLLK